MGKSHTFRRIRYQIPCYKRILHSDVAHGDSVADSDRRKYNRCSSRHGNTHFDRVNDLIDIHMSRNNFIIRTYNTDKRSVHLFLGKSESMKQGSVGRLSTALFYRITFHFKSSTFIQLELLNLINKDVRYGHP